jgi:hypothetical protein
MPPPRCRVDISQTILYIVIACNVVKVIVMAITLWRLNQETIVTIGDAITSFLQEPDHTTKNCCLMSNRTINAVWEESEPKSGQSFQQLHREPWGGSISGGRWCTSLLLCGPLQLPNARIWLNKLDIYPRSLPPVSLRAELRGNRTHSAKSTLVCL